MRQHSRWLATDGEVSWGAFTAPLFEFGHLVIYSNQNPVSEVLVDFFGGNLLNWDEKADEYPLTFRISIPPDGQHQNYNWEQNHPKGNTAVLLPKQTVTCT